MKKEAPKHFTLDRDTVLPCPVPEEDAQSALEQLRGMAYRAAARIETILKNPKIPDSAKLPLVNIVLDRVYGKPEEMLSIQSDERALEKSGERIRAIAERVHSNTRTLE